MACESVWREAHGYEDPPSNLEAAAGVTAVALVVGAAWAVWWLVRRSR